MTNTLAYYVTEFITTVKGLLLRAADQFFQQILIPPPPILQQQKILQAPSSLVRIESLMYAIS
jgi:hypothetical protein